MPLKFQDYYKTLGVARDADAAAIKKAYRKLARQYHPDVNKSPGAEARFKEISEAYEVLSDTEKRRRYDELGSSWKAGQEFTPPPGWQNARYEFHGPAGAEFRDFGGGFSDFFDALFGGSMGGGRFRSGRERWAAPARGSDQEADLTITLAEAYHGARKSVALRTMDEDGRGRVKEESRQYEVTIPPGTTQGSRIRLTGQGAPGSGGGPAGDLLLHIHVDTPPHIRLHHHDLETDLRITPWEAALGANVKVLTLDGSAAVRIPPGTQSGQKIRLKEKGLPRRRGEGRGDLYAVVQIALPPKLTPQERELFEQLAKTSSFNPRG